MTEASDRAAGSFGPVAHAVCCPPCVSKLPTPAVFATKVVSTGAFPSDPPMYRTEVPDWTMPPSERAAGSEINGGDAVHGTTDPTGAGQGSERLPSGQKLTGLHARIPRSIVRLTVK